MVNGKIICFLQLGSLNGIGDEQILHPFLPWFVKEGHHIECHKQGPYGMFVPNTTDGLG